MEVLVRTENTHRVFKKPAAMRNKSNVGESVHLETEQLEVVN